MYIFGGKPAITLSKDMQDGLSSTGHFSPGAEAAPICPGSTIPRWMPGKVGSASGARKAVTQHLQASVFLFCPGGNNGVDYD